LSEEKPQSRKRTLAVVGVLIVIAIVSLGFVAYSSLNPKTVTVTQQQFLTNTQSQYLTQTTTSVSTVTALETVTTSVTNVGPAYIGPGYYNCGIYGCYPPSLGAYGNLCQSIGQNNTVKCAGYLSEPVNGCIELAIPYTNPYLLESTAYQFYTLRNTPSALPPAGSWITVTGQLGLGYTPGSNGASCPGNYINVSSIS
jgi:hypothetical protein